MANEVKEKLPLGIFRDEDGGICLSRCPKCHRENYILNVLSGRCTWCGYDANVDFGPKPKNESK